LKNHDGNALTSRGFGYHDEPVTLDVEIVVCRLELIGRLLCYLDVKPCHGCSVEFQQFVDSGNVPDRG
jgi:hypothetical protein